MSATMPGRELSSSDSRRRPHAKRSVPQQTALVDSSSRPASGSPAARTDGTPDPRPAVIPQSMQPSAPETWWESLQRAERARAGRLRSLWQMTPQQRTAAMRRGDLTYEQLAAWSARHPEQVPTVHGEFEWIVAKLPEVCE